MKTKIVVLSGGMDSTTLLYDVVDKVGADNTRAITFNYGQRHSIEVQKASVSCNKLGVEHKIIDISFLGDLVSNVSALISTSDIPVPDIEDILGDPAPVTEVPYRNMVLVSLALSYAQAQGADAVFMGLQAQDQYSYWDTSLQFVESINGVSKLNRKHSIEISAPYATMSKSEELVIGDKLNIPYEDTWTCYTGPTESGKACGTCPSCSERIMAFMKNDIVDPLSYIIDIDWDNA